MIKYKEIDFKDLTFGVLSHLKCINCGMFRRNYHCLASPKWESAKEILSEYEKIYLIYIRVNNEKRINDLKEQNKERIKNGKRPLNDWIIKKNACNANQSILYSLMRRFMIDLKSNFKEKKLKLFGSGGGCRACRVCGLIKPQKINEPKTPCKKPDQSFNAPESWGIDVYSTLKNVGIEFEVIPEKILINVGMVFVND